MTLAQQAYDHIREAVIAGRITPGMRLSDFRISKELGVSRTPVRQAIDRLRDEGVVDDHPSGGVVLRQPTVDELIELFDMREMVECHAIARAAEQVDDAALSELRESIHRIAEAARLVEVLGLKRMSGEIAACVDVADAKFHLRILELSDSPMLMGMVREQHVFSRVFGYRHYTSDVPLLKTLQDICTHHTGIVDALATRDPQQAQDAMRAHLQNARERLTTAKRNPSLAGEIGEEDTFETTRSGAHLQAVVRLENSLGCSRSEGGSAG